MPPISIFSLNLRFGLADDGANNWPHRRKGYPDMLARHGADFYCFQEANDFQIDFLKDRLRAYHVIGQRQPAPEFWQHNIIFYHRRWECECNDHFYLSHTPAIPSRFSNSKWPRQCTMGRFRCGLRRVACINTHFDFKPGVQMGSARLILRRIAAWPKDLPVIVCGDFNATPDSCVHGLFTHNDRDASAAFQNVFSAPFPGTFHGFRGIPDGKHIDWILYRGSIEKRSAQVITDQFSGVYPSDHFPVTAAFSYEGD